MNSPPHPDRDAWRPATGDEERADADLHQVAKRQREAEERKWRRIHLGYITVGLIFLVLLAVVTLAPRRAQQTDDRREAKRQAQEFRNNARLLELRAANTSRLMAYPPTGSGAPLMVASWLTPSSCGSQRELLLRDALARSQPLPDVRCEPELAWWKRGELALRELFNKVGDL